MMMKNVNKYIVLILAAFLFLSLKAKAQLVNSKTYTNPVLDVTFPDPSVIRAPNGWFYAYATRTYHNEQVMINLQIAKSRDLVHWKYLADGMPVKPVWADSTEQFWAPDIHYDSHKKLFILYIASRHNGSNKHCIGILTSKLPGGPFKDIGHPLICANGYQDIDPMEFKDPRTGNHYLMWGSARAPIKIRELDNSLMKFKKNSRAHIILLSSKNLTYNSLVEGPWMIYRKGYYYLFTSGNNCCGIHAHYAVIVARSHNILGPYKRFKGVDGSGNGVILEKNSHWIAPGHNAIITTDHGKQYWILYHAINPKLHFQKKVSPVGMRFDRRVMLLDRIVFRDGWPRVKGNSPSYTAQPAPIIVKEK